MATQLQAVERALLMAPPFVGNTKVTYVTLWLSVPISDVLKTSGKALEHHPLRRNINRIRAIFSAIRFAPVGLEHLPDAVFRPRAGKDTPFEDQKHITEGVEFLPFALRAIALTPEPHHQANLTPIICADDYILVTKAVADLQMDERTKGADRPRTFVRLVQQQLNSGDNLNRRLRDIHCAPNSHTHEYAIELDRRRDVLGGPNATQFANLISSPVMGNSMNDPAVDRTMARTDFNVRANRLGTNSFHTARVPRAFQTQPPFPIATQVIALALMHHIPPPPPYSIEQAKALAASAPDLVAADRRAVRANNALPRNAIVGDEALDDAEKVERLKRLLLFQRKHDKLARRFAHQDSAIGATRTRKRPPSTCCSIARA